MKNLRIVLPKTYDANSYFLIDETPTPQGGGLWNTKMAMPCPQNL
jgi:hypothetical protein